MKPVIRYSLLAVLLISLTTRLFALDAALTTIVYATPDKPYLEVCLEIAGPTVEHVAIDSNLVKASVEVIIFLRVEGTEDVFSYEKYVLNGPEVRSPQSLLDIKRFSLPNGRYNLELKLRDLNNANNVHFLNRAIEVKVGEDLYMSDIQLLRNFRPEDGESAFHRNGFFMEPLPFFFYDRGSELLIFYAEIYHSNQGIEDENYLIRYLVEEELGNGKTRLWGSGSQRKAPSPIDAVLVQMDISEMESGNYRLTVEVRNNANEVLAVRKMVFQRSNPLIRISESEITPEMLQKEFVQQLNTEELEYALRALSPLVRMGDEPEELRIILKELNDDNMRFFLFRYFVRADGNNPEQAYNNFMEIARAIDNRFQSGFRYGFETDRGRTFLRYGKPDDMIHVEDEPSAPPYEIWVYYEFPVTDQQNVKFLFYNPTLAGEDFVMLHSTARGEINNPRWERELYSRHAGEQYEGDNYHDATEMQRNVHRNARIYFEDF